MHKVKHLGWYRFFASEDDISSIIRTPLEVMQETLLQFGAYPLDSMPSLERLIVHNYQFSYWVDLKVLVNRSASIIVCLSSKMPIKMNFAAEQPF